MTVRSVRGLVTRLGLQYWLLLAAQILRLRAAGMEPAAVRRVDRGRHVAGEDDPAALGGRVRISGRGGGKQRGGVRMPGALVDLVLGPRLGDASRYITVTSVADVPDDLQVVGR